MMVVPPHIWRVPLYLPDLQPPLTTELVTAAERQLGVRLPPSYLALLSRQNGGLIRLELPDAPVPHRCIWGIGPGRPSLTENVWWQAAADFDLAMPIADRHLLVPFDGEAGWFLALDYRADPEAPPRITLIDTEMASETVMAADFDSYLGQLELPDEQALLGFAFAGDLDAISGQLAALLTIGPTGTDSSGGYPVHEWLLRGGTIRLAANLVAAVEADPDRPVPAYAVALPEKALRMPEYPDADYILACASDPLAARMEERCREAGMKVWRLN